MASPKELHSYAEWSERFWQQNVRLLGVEPVVALNLFTGDPLREEARPWPRRWWKRGGRAAASEDRGGSAVFNGHRQAERSIGSGCLWPNGGHHPFLRQVQPVRGWEPGGRVPVATALTPESPLARGR
jgi:hypothetical protein